MPMNLFTQTIARITFKSILMFGISMTMRTHADLSSTAYTVATILHVIYDL